MNSIQDAQEAQRLAARLQPFFLSYAGSLDLGRGTAMPTIGHDGAAVQAGARFFRTDLGFACYMDGTRWLTVHELTMGLAQQTYTVNTTSIVAPFRGGFAPYITRVSTEYQVATTNNAGNKWTLLYRGVNAAYAAATQIHSFNSDAPGAGVWALDDGAPNTTATPANQAFVDFGVSKTGSPGTIQVSLTIAYRLIVT
jgi:hypothetical protein